MCFFPKSSGSRVALEGIFDAKNITGWNRWAVLVCCPPAVKNLIRLNVEGVPIHDFLQKHWRRQHQRRSSLFGLRTPRKLARHLVVRNWQSCVPA